MMLAEAVLEGGSVRAGAPAPGCPLHERVQDGLVTVVVTAGPRRDDLAPVIAALLGNLDTTFEVLVVDDDRDDHSTRQLVEAYGITDARVRYVREPCPGRAHARNTGLRFSRGSIVAFVDGDCLPELDWVYALRRAFDAHPNATFVLGRVVDAGDEQSVSLSGAGTTTVAVRQRHDVAVCQLGHRTDAQQLAGFFAGRFGSPRNLAIQKRHLPDLWSFDTSLGPGTYTGAGDDIDAVVGGLLERWALVYEPAAILHDTTAGEGGDDGHPARGPTVPLRELALGAIVAKRGLVGRNAALVRGAVADAMAGSRDSAAKPLAAPRAQPERSRMTPGGIAVGDWRTLGTQALTYVRGRLRDSWRTA